MKQFRGQALSWAIKDGVIELALQREPCNEIGSLCLEELEQFTSVLPELEQSAHSLILYSDLPCGFSAGADLRELYQRSQEMQKKDAVAGVREFLERIHHVMNTLDACPLQTIAAVLANPEKKLPSESRPPKKIVLCVEDEKAQLKMRKMLLESAGFQVIEAQSARLAMEAFRSSHVDAVVMDYWLSGQNGTALAEEMKTMRPRIPIVMLSGFASLPGEEAIVDSWLRKAEVEPEDLIHELTRLIALRATPRQAEKS